MPYSNAWWLGGFQGRELKKYCYIHNICNEIFLWFFTILLGIVVSALAFHTWGPVSFPGKANLQITLFSFFSFSSCRNHQTFLIRFTTFNHSNSLPWKSFREKRNVNCRVIYMSELKVCKSKKCMCGCMVTKLNYY